MLEKLRDGSKGWFAAIMVLILVGSFGMWGVQDMLNLSEQPKIAVVGDEVVSPERFQQEFSRFLGQMARATNSEMSTQQAKAAGLDRVALERFVKKLALLKYAHSMGLTVSPSQIVDAMKPIQGMVDKEGKLNPGALAQIARTNDMSEEQFLELITGDLLREQLLRTVVAGVRLPIGLESALNRFRLERRVTEFVVLDPSRAGEIEEPTAATLQKFYETLAATRYSTPETRTVVFVVARPEDVSVAVNITDDEIAKIYEANRRLYETPEKRTLEQIRFKTENSAKAAKLKLDAGTTFEVVAKAEGFGAEDIKLGEVSKTDKTIPATAFELPLMEASQPVKGPFGWVILRALSSTPGSLRTLEEVRDEIRKTLFDARSKDALFELTNKLEDTLGTGATLEEAAAKHKLPLRNVTVTVDGNDPAGSVLDGLPGGEFLQQVFAADAGTDPELLQTNDGIYYEFRVDKVSKSMKKPLDGIRAQVVADWRDEEVSIRLKKLAADVLKRANSGESMSVIAASLGVSVVTSDPVPRYGKTPMFSESTVEAAGAAKKGAFFSGPVAFGKGIIVGRVSDIQFQSEPVDAPTRLAYIQRLGQAFVSDFVEQFENGVREDAGTTIDEARFQSFHNNE